MPIATPSPRCHLSSTTALISCGVAAGPLFMTVSIIQGLTRDGFELTAQPISFLSLGHLGWIQQLNFILTGVLVLAYCLGAARAGGRGERISTRLLGGLGLGLILAGLFPPDPGFGFPPGTPAGPPQTITHHSQLHGLGFTVAFGSFALACGVYSYAAARRRNWSTAAITAITAGTALALALTPGAGAIAVRDLIAAALLWLWVTARALQQVDSDQRSPRLGATTAATPAA